MVDVKKGQDIRNPRDASLTEEKAHAKSSSGDPSPRSHERVQNSVREPGLVSNGAGVTLIPALRNIISSTARLIGPPLGNNDSLIIMLRRLHAVLGRLSGMTDEGFFEALEELAGRQDQLRKGGSVEFSSRPLRELPIGDIERMIADPKITKQQLLAIVRERFEGSTGTLAKLNHEALVERVSALVMNERGHETVARLASVEMPPPSIGTGATSETQAASSREQLAADVQTQKNGRDPTSV